MYGYALFKMIMLNLMRPLLKNYLAHTFSLINPILPDN